MSVSATNEPMTLSDIRRACGLGPLSGDNLEKYWVDTDAARAINFGLRNRIKRTLEDEPDARILVYGHGGCGKSTEIAKLIKELGSDFFVAGFSIRSEMNLTAVQPEDILLVLTERLLHAAQKEEIQIGDSILAPVHEYFSKIERSTVQARGSSFGVSADAGIGTGFLGSLVKLFAAIKSEIKLSVHSTETITAVLRKRPADLITQVNIVINAIRQALPKGRRLLLIVEDLDKLDIASARRVFIENANLLTGIAADIIYTIPIFTFHSPDASVLQQQFRPIGLPMIKVMEWNLARTPGFETVRAVIHKRLGKNTVTENALDLLIEKTGGVLQHAFEVLRNAALLDSAKVPLTKQDIEESLKYKRSEFWSEISLPTTKVDGVNSVNDLYDRLAEYAIRQLKGERNSPTVDAINQILLRSCALVEYNGDRWYGVHPLVIENLRQLGRIA